MITILNLFGRSPFAPLQSHMEKVADCIHQLVKLFEALQNHDFAQAEKIAAKISKLEHEADLTKNNIRNHLPKSLFLAIDRSALLEILTIQDSLADKAEDIAVLVTLKPLEMLDAFKEDFNNFLKKNLDCFDGARQIIKELHELLESSFGGIEAENVRTMAENVAYQEHEADLIQRKLLKSLFQAEEQMSYMTFYLWQRTFESVGAISNLSENLADRIRMTLDLK